MTRNALWLIGGRLYQTAVNLAVSMVTARYLGPANYGLLHYAVSLCALFTAVCTLGLNDTLVNELLNRKQAQGAVLGTAIGLRLVSGSLSAVTATLLALLLNPEEPATVTVVLIYSTTLILQSTDALRSWYQSRLRSRVAVVVTAVSYTAAALFRVGLLVWQKDIRWFAGAHVLQYVLTAVLLLSAYGQTAEDPLRFDRKSAKELLSRSAPFLLSGLMVALYGQIDRIMLKSFCDDAAVGLYSAAAAIPLMWTFVLTALIDSAKPVLLARYGKDQETFEAGLIRLYGGILYLSLGAGLILSLFARPILWILYGEAFLEAQGALRILCWGTGFSYWGVARSIWLVPQGKQSYEKYLAAAGAVCNYVLNWLWIPVWGILGAAAAHVLTQIAVNGVLGWFFPGIRRNNLLILRSLWFWRYPNDLL